MVTTKGDAIWSWWQPALPLFLVMFVLQGFPLEGAHSLVYAQEKSAPAQLSRFRSEIDAFLRADR